MPTTKKTTQLALTPRRPRRPAELTGLKRLAPDVLSLTVDSDETRARAEALLGPLQVGRRLLTAKYDRLLAPLNAIRAEIHAWRKEDAALVEPLETHLDQQISDYDARRLREAEAQARAALEAAPTPDAIQTEHVTLPPRMGQGFSRGRTHVSVEVTDLVALAGAVGRGEVSPDALRVNEAHFREGAEWYREHPAPGVTVGERRGKIVFRRGAAR